MTKRHRSGSNWIYQRKNAVVKSLSTGVLLEKSSEPSRVPFIQSTRPGEENLPIDEVRRRYQVEEKSAGLDLGKENVVPEERVVAASLRKLAAPRRFHLSRAALRAMGVHPSAGVSKKRPVLVEGIRNRAQKKLLDKRASRAYNARALDEGVTRPSDSTKPPPAIAVSGTMESANPNAPSDELMQNPDLMRQLQEWTLEEGGSQAQQSPRRKPKAPLTRRFQRQNGNPGGNSGQVDVNPGLANVNLEQANVNLEQADANSSSDEDGDYELVEYERVRREHVGGLDPNKVGVIDLDPDDDTFFLRVWGRQRRRR